MHIGQALDLVSRYDSLRNPLTSLGDYLDPELISRCLAESGTVTLRKRRLPLEMMVWCIVGMALERKEPLHQIVNRLDIMLPAAWYPFYCYRRLGLVCYRSGREGHRNLNPVN